jgi:hypothetical protein
MVSTDKINSTTNKVLSAHEALGDDALLEKLGYKSVFKREFSVRISRGQARVCIECAQAFGDSVIRVQYHGRHSIRLIHAVIRSSFWRVFYVVQ